MFKRKKEGGTEELRNLLLNLSERLEELISERLREGLKKEMEGLREEIKKITETLETNRKQIESFLKKEAENKKEGGEVAILIDWDNLLNLLSKADLFFEGETVLKEIREKLQNKIAFAKIFYGNPWMLPRLYQMSLMKAGYQVVFCPPPTLVGGDTVDMNIWKEVEILTKSNFIKSVVIISGDRDILFAVNRLRDAGKEIILVHFDGMSRVLRDKKGIILIKLPSFSKYSEIFEEKENPFLLLLQTIENDRFLDLKDPQLIFFLWIIFKLREVATLEAKRGFRNIVERIWADAYPTICKAPGFISFRRLNVEAALSALKKGSDFLLQERTAETIFYRFNPRSSLWPKILKITQQVLGERPEIKSYFQL